MTNTCPVCDKPCRRTYCSQACSAIVRRSRTPTACIRCGRTFGLRPCDERKGGGRFCSDPCRRAYQAEHAKVYLRVGRKYVHRIVAEHKLGRPLAAGEVVHHIDGNIHNNSPDNLAVCQSQAEHIRQEIESGQRVYTTEDAVRRGKLSGAARRAKSGQTTKPRNSV